MGNSTSSQGSSTGTHDGDVGSSISEEQHDWPMEQAADIPEIQSLQEMRKLYNDTGRPCAFILCAFSESFCSALTVMFCMAYLCRFIPYCTVSYLFSAVLCRIEVNNNTHL